MLTASVVALLAGCELLPAAEPPPAPPNPPGIANPVAKVVKSKPRAAAETHRSAKAASKPAPAPVDLLERIREALTLPGANEPVVDSELRFYASHPDYLNRVFTRANRYLHYIVGELERREMPLDLALLPVVESAYDPFAYSHGRAAGLWQIIPGTGRHLGLKQNWWYDARRDVIESTRGALDYLERLHEMFDGDWLLAVAGYNSGEGNVSRALRRASDAGDPADFWHIRRYLPVETRIYVPRFLAISAIVAEPAAFDVSLPELANEPYFEIVATGGQIDLALAAELTGLSTDALYALNAGVNRWATDPDGPHRLLVPADRAPVLREALARLGDRERVEWSRHVVSPGQTLGRLAEEYRTTTAVLREVNGISGTLIRVGQVLMIPHALDDMSAYTQSVESRRERHQNIERTGIRITHTVTTGDSLWAISQRYGVGVRELAGWNGMAPGDVLSVGRRIVVWAESGPATSVSNVTAATPASSERIRRIDYSVRRGDSLARISQRFRVTLADLLRWNDVSVDDYLQPGQRLLLYVDVTNQTI
ncbi:MAG TPA: LysM peptidoglycan-binding domain-containing protein [Gammaproteobacteria bacterium]